MNAKIRVTNWFVLYNKVAELSGKVFSVSALDGEKVKVIIASFPASIDTEILLTPEETRELIANLQHSLSKIER